MTNVEILDLIDRAVDNNEDAILTLSSKYKPILKSQTALVLKSNPKLDYEDVYSELLEHLIYTIRYFKGVPK